MADRYWVGGTDNWNGTAGTKWSATSGGAGGAAIPTTSDNVFFDASSGVGTVTLATGAVFFNLDCTGFAGTISHPTLVAITAAGTLYKLVAGMTFTAQTGATTNRVDFTSTSGTTLITTAGKTQASITFDGAGGTWTLQDALTTTTAAAVTVTRGTFNTNGQTCSFGFFASNNSNTRTVNLGSSIITLTGSSGTHWNLGATVTFDAGTSTINVNNTSTMTFSGAGFTYYDVVFNHPGAGTGATIAGANTFRNFTFALTAGSSTSGSVPNINNDFTVTGLLTLTGFAANARVTMLSNVATAITITAASVSLMDVDFIGITGAGAAAPFTGTRLGDGCGNTGITFDTPVSRYAIATGNWSTTAVWAASSGGASGASVPLPQDNVFLDAASGAVNVTRNMVNSGNSINCTGFTGTLTMSQSNGNLFGDFILVPGMTATLSGTVVFRGGGSITLAGKSFAAAVVITARKSTYTLTDAFTTASTLTLSLGNFNANGFDVACLTFNSSNSNTRTLSMGSGTWTLTSTGTVWSTATVTGLTLNEDTSTISITDTSASSKTINNASAETLYNISIAAGGTGAIIFAGCSYNNFVVLGGPKTLQFNGDVTIRGTPTLVGSAGNLISIVSNTPGTPRTLTKSSGTVSGDYLSIQDSTAAGGARWFAGNNSTNNGGNSGWIFSAPTAGGTLSMMGV